MLQKLFLSGKWVPTCTFRVNSFTKIKPILVIIVNVELIQIPFMHLDLLLAMYRRWDWHAKSKALGKHVTRLRTNGYKRRNNFDSRLAFIKNIQTFILEQWHNNNRQHLLSSAYWSWYSWSIGHVLRQNHHWWHKAAVPIGKPIRFLHHNQSHHCRPIWTTYRIDYIASFINDWPIRLHR